MRLSGVYDTIMERMQDIRNAHVDTGCGRCEHPIRQVAWGLWKVYEGRSSERYAPFTRFLLTSRKCRHVEVKLEALFDASLVRVEPWGTNPKNGTHSIKGQCTLA
jgi:hypothetical protein